MNLEEKLTEYTAKHKIKIPTPTFEQYNILNNIFINKHNVTISSCPGSGKTTLIQYIALLDLAINNDTKPTYRKPNEHNILVLMYNKALSIESNKKFKKNKCKNIRCQTIHSFAYNNYNITNKSYDDTLLLDILNANTQPNFDFKYTMIIIDEFQDATPLLFRFVEKVIIDNILESPQIIIMGDPLQELYKFRGADSRFMTLSNYVFLGGRLNFKSLSMTYTNRCPKNICRLINVCNFGLDSKWEIMKSHKQGGYIRICIGNTQKIIIDEIRLLKMKDVEFKMEDIMIIVPSLKNVNKLKNTLTRNGIYVVVSDSENLDSKTTKNKILITTFHGSKGLERKICFVTNFSNDYYKYYATDHDPEQISNTFYVALSRSSEYLYLLRNSNSEFPVWCKREILEQLKIDNVLQLYEEPLTKNNYFNNDIENHEEKKNTVNVSELTKNLSTEFKQEFSNIVEFIQLSPINISLKYDDIVCTNASSKKTNFYDNGYKIYENVSRFIGQSVTILFEFFIYHKQQQKHINKNRKPSVLDNIDLEIETMTSLYPDGNAYIRYYNQFLSDSKNSILFKDILYYCVLRESLRNEDISLLNQIRYLHKIKDIFQIPINDIDTEHDSGVSGNYEQSKLITHLQSVVDETNECLFEQFISCSLFGKNIFGRIDIICDNHRIIEIKFKNSLDVEDYVQLFLYNCIMHQISKSNKYNYEIYNAKTGEHYRMKSIKECDMHKLLKLLLFENNAYGQTHLNDSEFIQTYKLSYYDNINM